MARCGIPTFICILLLVSLAALYARASPMDNGVFQSQAENEDPLMRFTVNKANVRNARSIHIRYDDIVSSRVNLNNRGRQGRIADSGGFPLSGRGPGPGPNGARRRPRPGRGRGRGRGRVIGRCFGAYRRMMRLSRRVYRATTPFTLHLLKAVLSQPEHDFVMCPLCLHTLLTMTYMGARRSTAREMMRTLGLAQANLRRQTPHQAYRALWGSIYPVKNANAVFVKPNIAMEHSFRYELNQTYNARFSNFDFSHPLGAEAPINAWLSSMTDNKIQRLLTPGFIDPDTAMILINAVYFNASWALGNSQLIGPEPFHTLSQGVKHMDMIKSTGLFRHASRDNVEVVRVPYAGTSMDMYIFLPSTTLGLQQFVHEMDTEGQTTAPISYMFDNWTTTQMEITLPKFKIDSGLLNLKTHLQNMGMRKAFKRNKADFSGISASAELFIQSVLHKAVIEVTDNGTEACPGNSCEISTPPRDNPLPKMEINRPFLFTIRERTLNVTLFFGTYLGQRAEEVSV